MILCQKIGFFIKSRIFVLMMEETKKLLRSIITQNANEYQVYMPITELFLMSKLSVTEFENVLVDMQTTGEIYITPDMGDAGIYYKVTLLSLINHFRRKNFENAIVGIKEMLEASIEREDYESAAEYRDMLKEAETDFKDVKVTENGYKTD